MSKLRSLNTSFWSDPFIEDLKPDEKLVFIYLITNDKTNMLGIYESSIRKMSFETGVEKKRLETILKAFEGLGKVKYINNYVVLTNYLKHQNFNTNMKKSAIDCYNNLPKELKNSSVIVDKSNPSEGFETLLNHYGMVRKVEVEYELEIEIEEEEEIEEELHPFLIWFNSKKKEFTGKQGKSKMLSETDKKNLSKLKKTYDTDDFNHAVKWLFKNQWAKENNNLTPTHFLRNDNFNRYYQSEESIKSESYNPNTVDKPVIKSWGKKK